MKFAFIAKHRSIWPLSSLLCNDCGLEGGMALRSAGSFSFRFPCLAQLFFERTHPL